MAKHIPCIHWYVHLQNSLQFFLFFLYINLMFHFLGVCYDSINNLIWTSSEDWVDEWLNIGASSYHHVVHKISPKPRGIVMCLKLLNLKSQGPKALP